MADELQARLDPSETGLTVVARLRVPGGTQQGSDIACPENGSVAGYYSGDVPGATPANIYTVDFEDTGSGDLVAGGSLIWDGTQEIDLDDLSQFDASLDTVDIGAVTGTPVADVTDFHADTSGLATSAEIAALNDLSIADVQTALDNQGYTAARAINLDNLDATISSVNSAIAALQDISIADVQTAMTNQGYTSARAILLDNLDDSITNVLAAIAALNDLSIADVQTAFDNQGYTAARAVLLDNLVQILVAVEKIRKDNTNRVVVNGAETLVTIYEDDGTTPAFQYTISGDKLTRTPV